MKLKSCHFLDILFQALCILIVFVMMTYWIYKYTYDEDVCLVDYKPIKQAKDIQYPEVSLCFQYPGPLNQKISSINFSRVSVNMTDYHLHTVVVWKNGSGALVKQAKPHSSFSGFKYGSFLKCFSVSLAELSWGDVKFMIHSYKIGLYEKHFHPSAGGVIARIHQPNQFLLTDDAQHLSSWMDASDGVSLAILMTSFEVLKRRNKPVEPCIKSWNTFDEMFTNEHIKEHGCSPPYFEPNKNLSVCSDEKIIEASRFDVSRIRSKPNFHPPCQGMSKIDYDYFDDSIPTSKGYLKIMIGYPEQVKIISQSQAVDVHTIVGNIGGYIGLFLGYALIQLPGMIGSLHSWIQNRSKINYKYPKEGTRKKSFAMNDHVKTSQTLKIGKRKCKILSDFCPRSVHNESANIMMNITLKLEALQSEMNYLKTKINEQAESQTKIEI